jgi:hypothetical protein
MKQLLLILILFLTAQGGQAQVPEPEIGMQNLDAKYGFRDAKFEMPISSMKGAVQYGVLTHGNRYYRRPTDVKKIGRYALSDITYTFYKGRLSSITITTKGYTNSQGVLEALQNLYGAGSKDNEYIEEYRWNSEKVMMNYERNSITDNATIYIWSMPIMSIEEADKENAAKKATSDL